MLRRIALTFNCCCSLMCLVFAPPLSADEMRMTSLCKIVSRPTSFDLMVVRVRASVMSDGMHSTILIDKSCPKEGVSYVVLQRSTGDPGVEKVDHAIYHVGEIGAGMFGKNIEATVSGIFLWEPDNTRAARRLLVESVSDVTVSTNQPERTNQKRGQVH